RERSRLRSRHHAQHGAPAAGARGDQQCLRLRRHQCGDRTARRVGGASPRNQSSGLAVRSLGNLRDATEHPMTDLTEFAISARWPARHPDRLQLYSFPTPNGIKVSAMLEETGLPYEAHLVNILKNETRTEPFLALNPNGKIPAII